MNNIQVAEPVSNNNFSIRYSIQEDGSLSIGYIPEKLERNFLRVRNIENEKGIKFLMRNNINNPKLTRKLIVITDQLHVNILETIEANKEDIQVDFVADMAIVYQHPKNNPAAKVFDISTGEIIDKAE